MIVINNFASVLVATSFEDLFRGLILGLAAEHPDSFYPACKAIGMDPARALR
jgi:hypothetical protein